ncbi:RDD family protein [Cellulomonas sp. 179-A 9B4 NHS]|uniref:RDD family protein n=1 Tax=Cellulomonas sp. 179-A 9B4 NHS TaxID=3142379 RepID=UPI0039A198B4
MTTPDGPPADWYDDGVTPGVERWFDGTDWTAHTRPVAATPPPPAAVPVAVPVAAGTSWTPGAPLAVGPGAVAAAEPAWQAPAAAGGAWGGAPSGTNWGAASPGGARGTAPGVTGGAWGTAWPPAGTAAGGEYAGWAHRVVANLLDSLVPLVPYGTAYAVAMATAVPGVDRYGNPTPQPTGTGVTVLLVGLALAWGLHGWNRWVRVARTGRSLGKQAMGLRVVLEETGTPPGVWMCLVRDVAHVLDNLVLYVGYLWPLWDARRQTFADKAVHTVVVRDAT